VLILIAQLIASQKYIKGEWLDILESLEVSENPLVIAKINARTEKVKEYTV